MPISGRDRKILWARSGNRCAFPGCKQLLARTRADGTGAFPVGEEAHVVAREQTGPRGDDPLPLNERDHYDNLILLCPSHHRIVDEDTGAYAVEVLRRMKEEHEQWVDSTLASDDRAAAAPAYPRPCSDVQRLERVAIPDRNVLYDVFISYSSVDEAWVRRLKDALQARGLRVWLYRDEIRPGDIFPQVLEQGITTSRAIAIIISPDAVASHWVREEYYQAVALENTGRHNVRIIPVLLRDAPLPGFLSSRQCVDFRDESKFEQSVDDLCWGVTGWRPPAAVLRVPEAQVSLSKLPVTDPDIFGRGAELKLLDEAWADPAARIVTIIALGGIGKSALVNKWIEQMAGDGYRGAWRVLGWSFYSHAASDHAASADQFMHSALIFFGDPDPHKGSPWDKGIRLARLIKQQRTLLILDGLEPLQWGPGPRSGEIKDRAGSMLALLRALSDAMDGLCVISSRLDVTDLSASDVCHPVLRINLEALSTEAGRALLTHCGVKGTDSELNAAVAQYDGHALALTLLGRYLADFFGGDAAGRGAIPILPRPMLLGNHLLDVMEAYDTALHSEGYNSERAILRIVGLFDGPAAKDCVYVLRCAPAITGVTDAVVGLSETDWHHAVARLRNRGLLSQPAAGDDGSLEAHPLVREYFGRKLAEESSEGFREAHSRLFDHLGKTAKPFPDTLAEMETILQAVRHGCSAGRHREALADVYLPRMRRGGSLVRAFGPRAWAADLAVLSCFFERPWRKAVAGLTLAEERFLVRLAGLDLLALGRLAEAAEALAASLDQSAQASDWRDAAHVATNLADVHLADGRLGEALGMGRLAVDLADRVHETSLLVSSLGCLATACRATGHLVEARKQFVKAHEVQSSYDSLHPVLDGVSGSSHHALLNETGDRIEARRQTALALEAAWDSGWRPDAVLAHASLGVVCSTVAAQLRTRPHQWSVDEILDEAARHLNHAVGAAREVSAEDDIVRVVLARAFFLRDFGPREEAHRDLREVLELSTRIGLRLHETDARLLEGHLALDEDQPQIETAQAALARAQELVRETGYHLRDADLLILEGRLLAKRGDKAGGEAKLYEAIKVAKREEADGAVYQVAVDQAERYLKDLGL